MLYIQLNFTFYYIISFICSGWSVRTKNLNCLTKSIWQFLYFIAMLTSLTAKYVYKPISKKKLFCHFCNALFFAILLLTFDSQWQALLVCNCNYLWETFRLSTVQEESLYLDFVMEKVLKDFGHILEGLTT